ncbi:cytochrome c [Magnetospirillum sp. 15-1]|uniref:c-type cytochrome n=1 Tax=Magnetospirillum sp. 15-1 TaxID=1979370 RepID=UPI000BBBF5D7|nr:cytochrome c [Magnetospirillum sp. 15-1]
MRFWGLALVVLAVTGVAAWVWWPRGYGINPQDARQVAMGYDLYNVHCSSCHGHDLRGEPDWQTRKPSGELPAPPHDASGHTWHHPEEQLFAIIKHGMARFAPPGYKTAMPSFVGTLSDSEIKAVLSYIESTWPAEIRERRAAMLKH